MCLKQIFNKTKIEFENDSNGPKIDQNETKTDPKTDPKQTEMDRNKPKTDHRYAMA